MTEVSLIIKATVILGVALTATVGARRARASIRALILASAFGLLLLLPVASAIAPPREVQVPTAYAPRFFVDEEWLARLSTQNAVIPLPVAQTTPMWQFPSLRALLRAVWLIGMFVATAPLLLGLWRTRGLRHRAREWAYGRKLAAQLGASVGLRRRVTVVCHDDVVAPMTCGWPRPTIVMPADAPNWPDSDVRQALLHELEHVCRLDWPVLVLARFATALYWFHPAAWVALRQLSLESERACDDAVVVRAENTAYAAQLVSLARRFSRRSELPLLSMADRRTLSTRVAAILSTTAARGRVGAAAAVFVLSAAAVLTATIAPIKAVGAQTRERATLRIPISTEGRPFEVVSVKPNDPDDRLRVNDWQPVAGRLTLRNLTPKVMLTFAYADRATLFLPDDRLVGVPEWADRERFTIEAAAGRSVTAAEMQRMLRWVLVERFGLKVHLERREQSAYRLTMARAGGRLGPNLQRANEAKCDESKRPRGGSEQWGPQLLVCITMDLFSLELAERLDRPVVNQTGLTGIFSGTLSYSPSAEELAVVYRLAPSELPPAAFAGPSLMTALQEQLGLKLESTRAAIDVLVIDSLERPTEN
jgi:bla regulator protein blaR1